MYKISLIIFLFFLDILSKQIVFYSIGLNKFIYMTFFLDLAHIHNYGISFGLFSGFLPSWLFVVIGFIILAILLVIYSKSNKSIERWGYTCILAGAFGNILDRAFNGFVIDFIYLHYKDFYWPAFNFADIYISIGILIIIFQILTDASKRDFK